MAQRLRAIHEYRKEEKHETTQKEDRLDVQFCEDAPGTEIHRHDWPWHRYHGLHDDWQLDGVCTYDEIGVENAY